MSASFWTFLLIAGFIFQIWYVARRRDRRLLPVEYAHDVEFKKQNRPDLAAEDDEADELVEFVVTLPDAFGALHLADAQYCKRAYLKPDHPMSSGDPSFDAAFDFLSSPPDAAHELVENATVRHMLLDLTEAFRGVLVEDGALLLYDVGPMTDDSVDIAMELVGGLLAQLDLP
ncbi:MAG: hypothetical protein ACYTGQ_17705 [Planctomycetota bacterium]|jgi:hypothetical protein